jgi:hypothetical protein
MLFLIQRVLGAGVKFEFLDPAHRFALVVVFEEDAIGHEFAAGAAAKASAVSAFISRLQIDKKLSDFMVVVVLHSEKPSYLMEKLSIARSDDRNQGFLGRCYGNVNISAFVMSYVHLGRPDGRASGCGQVDLTPACR